MSAFGPEVGHSTLWSEISTGTPHEIRRRKGGAFPKTVFANLELPMHRTT